MIAPSREAAQPLLARLHTGNPKSRGSVNSKQCSTTRSCRPR